MPLLLLLLLSGVVLGLWFVGFIIRTDFSVPDAILNKYKRILVIFPHPDDEALTTGGLIRKSHAVLHLLTKGERGTVQGRANKSQRLTRSKEAELVAEILGVSKLIHDDLGDGQLKSRKVFLNKRLEQVIKAEKPDLVVTYDLSGLYGHSDHIICSEVITDLVREQFPGIKLWYVTHPKKILKLAKLPEHMAENPNFTDKRTYPTVKLFIGTTIIPKIRAVYAYKSQYDSFRSAFPFRFLPLWFLVSMSLHEYFYEAN